MYDSDSFKRTETEEPMLLSEILSEDPKRTHKSVAQEKEPAFRQTAMATIK